VSCGFLFVVGFDYEGNDEGKWDDLKFWSNFPQRGDLYFEVDWEYQTVCFAVSLPECSGGADSGDKGGGDDV
jgi:hypothetical protein